MVLSLLDIPERSGAFLALILILETLVKHHVQLLKVEEEDNSSSILNTASFGLSEGPYERVTVQCLDHMCGPFLARSVTEQRSGGMLRTHTEETPGQCLEGRCLKN